MIYTLKMYIIVSCILLMILQIGSLETEPELCDKSLKEKNMFNHMFNINNDIFITRNEWIFKMRRYANDMNDGRMIQMGNPIKINRLFPHQKDIKISISYPTKYVFCGWNWNGKCRNNEPISRKFCCALLKDSKRVWTLYVPKGDGFESASLLNKNYQWIHDFMKDVDFKYHTCIAAYDETTDRADHIIQNNCTDYIGAISYQTDDTGKTFHYFLGQQMYRRIITPQKADIKIEYEWGKSHWKLFRCDETMYSTVSDGKTHQNKSDDSYKSGVNVWAYVIIGIIIIIVVVTFCVIYLMIGYDPGLYGSTQVTHPIGNVVIVSQTSSIPKDDIIENVLQKKYHK